jgi:hypothetical protein
MIGVGAEMEMHAAAATGKELWRLVSESSCFFFFWHTGVACSNIVERCKTRSEGALEDRTQHGCHKGEASAPDSRPRQTTLVSQVVAIKDFHSSSGLYSRLHGIPNSRSDNSC